MGVGARRCVKRRVEAVFSECESHSIRITYDYDLLHDFFPPASVLVFFLETYAYYD